MRVALPAAHDMSIDAAMGSSVDAARLALPAGALRLYHRGEREKQIRIDSSFFRVRRLAAALAISER